MKKFNKRVINFADKIINTHVEVISDLLICSAGTGIDFAIVDVKNSIKAFDRIKNGGFSNNKKRAVLNYGFLISAVFFHIFTQTFNHYGQRNRKSANNCLHINGRNA